MNIVASLINLEKKFPWTLVSLIFAIIFFVIGFYPELIRDDNPSLVVEIISNTNVLDLKEDEDVKELKITYGNVDIKSLKQTLSVILLRIKNAGKATIKDEDYNKKFPPNIVVSSNVKLLKVEQLSPTSDYLKRAAIPSFSDNNIKLPEVDLEQDEGYTFKLLVLHPSTLPITFTSDGKITNVKRILIRESSQEEAIPYWKKAFQGDVLIQLGRLPVYFFGSIFVIIIPVSFVLGVISKYKRKKIVKEYRKFRHENIAISFDAMLDSYVQDDLPHLKEIKDLLSDKLKRRSYLDILKEKIDKREDNDSVAYFAKFRKKINKDNDIVRLLIKLKLSSANENGEIIINEKLEKELDIFIKFIEIEKKEDC
jgi:hypothetical protein